MRTHKITIKPIGEGAYKVLVDEQRVKARSINLHMDMESTPEIDIGLVGEPEMDVEGLVQFDYTPKTVMSAAKLIKAALIKNDITAFLAMNSLNKAIEEISGKS